MSIAQYITSIHPSIMLRPESELRITNYEFRVAVLGCGFGRSEIAMAAPMYKDERTPTPEPPLLFPRQLGSHFNQRRENEIKNKYTNAEQEKNGSTDPFMLIAPESG